MELFDYHAKKSFDSSKPLAERMRPVTLDEFAGQTHLTGENGLIRSAIDNNRIFSMILWGPPGCGKTTLAMIIACKTNFHFVQFSAVLSGVKEIRSVIEVAKNQLHVYRKRTILFVDEIHRFNKAQQDAFLHHVESGLITLIGATTENPSFEVIPALISRCRVITLNPVSSADIATLLNRAMNDKKGLGDRGLVLSKEAMFHLADKADGDVRVALGSLEIAASAVLGKTEAAGGAGEAFVITLNDAETALQQKALLYDKTGEAHYNSISAFHKSLRGSDPDASIYWLARMLASGEDPFYILRRMVRFASEDIGNADPNALGIALNAMETFRFLGYPEGQLAIAQAAIYLATAPKSNSVYKAFNEVNHDVKKNGALPVPMHIRNAPTKLMEHLGYGKGYQYAHDYKDAFTPQEHLPDQLAGTIYYSPTQRGYEKTIKERLDKWRMLKKNKKNL